MIMEDLEKLDIILPLIGCCMGAIERGNPERTPKRCSPECPIGMFT
jgi:hypothetical protein